MRAIPIARWLPIARSGIVLRDRNLELQAQVFLLVMALRATALDASALLSEAWLDQTCRRRQHQARDH